MCNKFSYIDDCTGHRWDFTLNPDRTVTIGYPSERIVFRTTRQETDLRVEFEGDKDAWIEWGATVLQEAGEVVFDEDLGLVSPETVLEDKREAEEERRHRRALSCPSRYLDIRRKH